MINLYDPTTKTYTTSDGTVHPFFSGASEHPEELFPLVGFTEGKYTLQEAYDYLMVLKVVQSKYTYKHWIGDAGCLVGADTKEELDQLIKEYITGGENKYDPIKP